MNSWLYDLAPGSITLLICIIFVGFTWGGILFIRPILRIFLRGQPGLNGILGNFLSIFGLFYGILLGLLAVASYQNKVMVENAIAEEATKLSAMFRLASTFPGDSGKEIQRDLINYSRFVIDEEWPQMRKGEIAYKGGRLVMNLMQDLGKIELQTPADQNLHAATLNAANRFLELRVRRIYSAVSGIPGIMWYVVLLGAFLNIVLLLLFEMKLMAHFLLGGILAFFIGTVVSLVMILDQPLRGDHGIAPTPYQLLNKAWTKEIQESGGQLSPAGQ